MGQGKLLGIARGVPVDPGRGWRVFCCRKYFTLLVLDMSDERLKLVTVRETRIHNQPHMALACFAAPETEPPFWDIFDKGLRPAAARTDPTVLDSYNETGLRGRGPEITGKADHNGSHMSRWNGIKRCIKTAA